MTKNNLVENYVAKIFSTSTPQASLETITALQQSHISKYSFNSISVLLKENIPLDFDSLYEKIVVKNRGGYCFEHNKLFFEILKEIGYNCTIQLARVVLNRDIDVPRTHRITNVSLNEREYLVDVGFGPNCPTAPLPLDSNEPKRLGDTVYRIIQPAPHNYLLQMDRDGEWFTLYSFDGGEYSDADCTSGNHFSSTHPEAVFVNNLVVARKLEGETRSLRNDTYHKIRGSETEITPISSEKILENVFINEMGINLSSDEIKVLYNNHCCY